MNSKPSNTEFFNQIVDLLQSAKNKVVQTVNQTIVTTYFEIGRKIVEEEQNGKDRAEYGKRLLIDLSNVLTKEFGKGFSVTNIQQMRIFYLTYENNRQCLLIQKKQFSRQCLSISIANRKLCLPILKMPFPKHRLGILN